MTFMYFKMYFYVLYCVRYYLFSVNISLESAFDVVSTNHGTSYHVNINETTFIVHKKFCHLHGGCVANFDTTDTASIFPLSSTAMS